MALVFKDQNGALFELEPTAVFLGLGTSQIGKEFEVAGNLVSRISSEAGGTGALLAAEGDPFNGVGSLWTNNAYDPGNAGRGWMRTISMKNGNVFIGESPDLRALLAEDPDAPSERLVVAGNIIATGDVQLAGADCAEEFDVDDVAGLDPGTVLVIGDDERLRRCAEAYDTKVAGVVSGAGRYRPGIVLGRDPTSETRLPLALTGKVYCKVDARYAPIGVGDLLTTSPTPGHGMKVTDARAAIGAILGKALRPLAAGQELIPVLVALQ